MITLTITNDALEHIQAIVARRFDEFIDDYQERLVDEDGCALRGRAARDLLAELDAQWRGTLDAVGLDYNRLVCTSDGKRYTKALSGEGDV